MLTAVLDPVKKLKTANNSLSLHSLFQFALFKMMSLEVKKALEIRENGSEFRRLYS